MRNEFVNYLITLAERDNNIFLLCGDLGYSVLEPFAEKFPDRFINIGIAEQNMVGIAAGLALCGKKVFTYSIVNFAIARCLEQIRNDVCYHNLDVTIVAVGGGMPYGSQGYTHLGIEDIALTRNLPNIRVMIPADKAELRYTMNKISSQAGPKYLRLGRGGEPEVYQNSNLLENKPIPIIELAPINNITILATGSIIKEAELAIKQLENHLPIGQVGLVSIPEISSINRTNIKNYLQTHANKINHLITLEEHLIYGGFGSYIAEIITSFANNIRLHNLGVTHENIWEIGDQNFLKKRNCIDSDSIFKLLYNLCNINEIELA